MPNYVVNARVLTSLKGKFLLIDLIYFFDNIEVMTPKQVPPIILYV